MRIAIITQVFGPTGGGQERWTFAFVQSLVARRHQVHVIVKKLRGSWEHLPITLHQVGVKSRSPFAFADAAQQVARQLACDIVHDMGDGWGGDLLHYHGGPYPLIAEHKLAALPPAARVGKKLLLRCLPSYRLRYSFAAEQIRRHHGIIVPLSRRQADGIRRLYNLPDERIRIVYNGVDVESFCPWLRAEYRKPMRKALKVDEATTVYLLAAFNFRLKGLSALKRAGEILARKGRKFRIIVLGGHLRRRWLHNWLGKEKAWLTFVGSVDDPRPYYAAADVYVHPTWYDSCSLAVLEALACGLPVITTAQNGASELMEDGKDGFVLDDPGDIAELADRMEQLSEEALRREMGEAARATALRHRFEDKVSQILDLYTECHATKRKAA
ncbi:MAG: glycosyltransferase family 4 protein [Thermoguttaceae bacterium]|nr:glycosyltransferase family 4 protein [Thermoguttaceae bacterium]MDW8078810.1 glycosyltransferase family 4 protein [Thermoguttaceae bacterium]